MSRKKPQFVYTMLFGIGFYAALSSLGVNASSEEELNPSSNLPSIEILILSRGRGVPETTFIAFQEIVAVANEALKSGTVVSVRQESIGLEGETRLCIVFQNTQTSAALANQIRELAAHIDLLQVNDNRCSGN